MSYFKHVQGMPPDSILELFKTFKADPRKNKVNLGIGLYLSEDQKVPYLNCFKKAASKLASQAIDNSYLPIDGDEEFLQAALTEILKLDQKSASKISLLQTIGGTGGLKIIAGLLKEAGITSVSVPEPSWANHRAIFSHAYLNVGSYPYYNQATKSLDFERLCSSLKQLPPGQAVLLHVCCHNPSGVDPSQGEWEEILQILEKKGLLPVFDSAYHGLGRGLKEDFYPIARSLEKGLEFCLSYSFSKNCSLYSERIGFIAINANAASLAPKIRSQSCYLVRTNYSSPPAHGATLVKTILSSPELNHEWKLELRSMCERLQLLRKMFCDSLRSKHGLNYFDFVEKGRGMFSLTGLSPKQIELLKNEYGIYLVESSRMNIAGLSLNNLEYVTSSFAKVFKDVP